MASSDQHPGTMPSTAEDVPGKPVTTGTSLVTASASVMQSFAPIKQISQHICTWAMYSHDMSRVIETHHHSARLNEDVWQCPVYDSDQKNARLIGVEYIVSEEVFSKLPEDEKKLWHSHFYEIKEGLWVNPGVPEMMAKQELKQLAKTYGKFWCTWQFDRGDRLPLGAPALMMSPQPECTVPIDMVKKRDEHYRISTTEIAAGREAIEAPAEFDPCADNWRKTKKGWAVSLKEVDMVLGPGAPLSSLHLGEGA